jgi:hypothetical protein
MHRWAAEARGWGETDLATELDRRASVRFLDFARKARALGVPKKTEWDEVRRLARAIARGVEPGG